MHFSKGPRPPRGAIRPAPLPDLRSAFAARRAAFGPHDLAEGCIRPASAIAADLAPEARRELRRRSAEASA